MSHMNKTEPSASNSAGVAGVYSAPVARVGALLADAAAHYRETLRSSPKAVSYLRRRGVSGAAASRFGLGFAPPGWHGLEPVLRQYDTQTVSASGLQVVKTDDASRCFDRFRDRIMFPIRARSGAVVGFGGRVLDGTQPKYMNSPESDGFKKRTLLYGLFEAESAIVASDVAVLVEGYLDVITLSQAGFSEVVGTLGTSCTPMQLCELLTLTPHLVFCFDGDEAGKRAAAHALENVLPLAEDSRSFRFLFLPDEHDPDSFVRAHGAEAFRALLSQALSLTTYLHGQILKGCDLSQAEGRALCSARTKPFWLALPEGRQRDELVNFCAELTHLSPDELLSIWSVSP